MNARQLTNVALLVALSGVGSFVKLAPWTIAIGDAGPWSIALDTAPGFFAALMIGPAEGALVCLLGHLVAAAINGFPLTPVFHMELALALAAVGAVGGFCRRLIGRLNATLIMILLYCLACPGVLALLPNPMGRALYGYLIFPMIFGATANGLVAGGAAEILERSRRRQ
ncbi:MAG TPA: ECF transporter S component [Symbiobacteriaceae bacterium]